MFSKIINRKKTICILISVWCIALIFLNSCNPPLSQTQLGDWLRTEPFVGIARNGAVTFTIDDNAFVGLGYNRDNNQFLNDFWKFNKDTKKWVKIANFAGEGRLNAVAFTVNGKGYVGTGSNGSQKELKDFYAYDPLADTWTRVADLKGEVRSGAVAFATGDKGYVGTGFYTSTIKNGLGDFFSYDPVKDEWTDIPSYPGNKVYGAFSFVIDKYAYVGGGIQPNTSYPDRRFYRFNASLLKWDLMPPLDSLSNLVPRFNTASFANKGFGYIACGAPNQSSTIFEFNPANKIWSRKTDFEGPFRSDCVGFVLPSSNGDGYDSYVGLGVASGTNTPNSDFWAFNPSVEKILEK